ncbi:phosphopantetheine-binding protein [Kangiella taiwanensis]|uniref:Carrier domain-containing protein n=1 Tax=Kangiella taiwanensis TaxID=1079179 RepID=A0ABP8HS48_9GAMM|nr:phosphopantetheine-binding protein [Kangiella taiwanensis]
MTFLYKLISLCQEYEIIPANNIEHQLDADLLESGIIDSMGVVMFQELLSEKFGMDVPTEKFIIELRTLRAIAGYVQLQLTEEELELACA